MNFLAVVSICNCSHIKQSAYTDPSETFQLKCQSGTWVVEEDCGQGNLQCQDTGLKSPPVMCLDSECKIALAPWKCAKPHGIRMGSQAAKG